MTKFTWLRRARTSPSLFIHKFCHAKMWEIWRRLSAFAWVGFRWSAATTGVDPKAACTLRLTRVHFITVLWLPDVSSYTLRNERFESESQNGSGSGFPRGHSLVFSDPGWSRLETKRQCQNRRDKKKRLYYPVSRCSLSNEVYKLNIFWEYLLSVYLNY